MWRANRVLYFDEDEVVMGFTFGKTNGKESTIKKKIVETMNVLFLISDLSMTLCPDSGRECGVPAELMYYVPADNRAILWYSTDYGMFHFCIADSEHDWREGSEQYAWIEKCLTSVDRQKQPWLIFSAHRVLGYSSKSWLTSEVVVAINDIVLFQGGAVKEVRSIVIDDPEVSCIFWDSRAHTFTQYADNRNYCADDPVVRIISFLVRGGPEIAFDSRVDDMSGVVKSRLEALLNSINSNMAMFFKLIRIG
ncbi:nucleotide pyrophosphatase/phosphodiesterase-like protein [Tanacetum coccineum]